MIATSESITAREKTGNGNPMMYLHMESAYKSNAIIHFKCY